MASITGPGSRVDDPLFLPSSMPSNPEPSTHPPKTRGTTTTTISITSPGFDVDDPLYISSSPKASPRPVRNRGTTTTTISITGPGSAINDPFFVESSPERPGSSVSRTVHSTRTVRRNAGPMPPRPLGSPLIIYGGQPSSISQFTRPPPATRLPLAPVASSSAAVSRHANSLESEDIRRQRRLGLDAVRSTEWAAELVRRRTLIGMSSSRSDRPTGIRIRRPGRRRRRLGWRTSRVFPLEHDDLYLSADRPQTMFTERAHHSCGICLQVKLHPVSYACGHSHCYVCIRMWLEYSWICPHCRAVMTEEPVKNYDITAAIRYDFPNRQDSSVVSYSWDGLHFPQAPTGESHSDS